jgi:hypothetical protein
VQAAKNERRDSEPSAILLVPTPWLVLVVAAFYHPTLLVGCPKMNNMSKSGIFSYAAW